MEGGPQLQKRKSCKSDYFIKQVKGTSHVQEVRPGTMYYLSLYLQGLPHGAEVGEHYLMLSFSGNLFDQNGNLVT